MEDVEFHGVFWLSVNENLHGSPWPSMVKVWVRI
jgi:hypothetical protein